MKKQVKIITHGGRAHRDEFLACCCVLWHTLQNQGADCIIERRMPGSMDLERDDVWVLDTGGVFDPRYSNYDHHQMTDSEVCTLDLVLQRLVGEEAYAVYKNACAWLKTVALHDNQGAAAAATALGVTNQQYMATRSPIERALLLQFSSLSMVVPGSSLHQLMLDIGRMILNEVEDSYVNVPDSLNQMAAPCVCSGVRVWDLRCLPCEWHSTTKAAVNRDCAKRRVDVIITQTDGDDGAIALFRQSWAADQLDLSSAAGHPHARFVHAAGFFAQLSPKTSDAEIREIIEKAVAAATKSDPAEVTIPLQKKPTTTVKKRPTAPGKKPTTHKQR